MATSVGESDGQTPESLLTHFPPMGVYETLFKFKDATGVYLGTDGTLPWAQGFPLTRQIPGGPSIPNGVAYVFEFNTNLIVLRTFVGFFTAICVERFCLL